MYTTYHLKSAQDITTDILDAIKAAYKAKPIKVTIEEDVDETAFLMASDKNKEILLKSIQQDQDQETIPVNLKD